MPNERRDNWPGTCAQTNIARSAGGLFPMLEVTSNLVDNERDLLELRERIVGLLECHDVVLGVLSITSHVEDWLGQ